MGREYGTLTKLMIDKIKLCNYMSLCVSVVAVLGTKSKLEKLKSNDSWLAYKNKIPVINQFNLCWLFSPSGSYRKRKF